MSLGCEGELPAWQMNRDAGLSHYDSLSNQA